jgi:hypothetical protein
MAQNCFFVNNDDDGGGGGGGGVTECSSRVVRNLASYAKGIGFDS